MNHRISDTWVCLHPCSLVMVLSNVRHCSLHELVCGLHSSDLCVCGHACVCACSHLTCILLDCLSVFKKKKKNFLVLLFLELNAYNLVLYYGISYNVLDCTKLSVLCRYIVYIVHLAVLYAGVLHWHVFHRLIILSVAFSARVD